MMRISILGNAGGGKSTLARRLSSKHDLPLYEVDKFLWRANWEPVSEEDYKAAHEDALAQDAWIIEGMGHRKSIAPRIELSTHVILVDMPLWQNFALTAQRQIDWALGKLKQRPGGHETMPPTDKLFEMMWMVDQEWMPFIRQLADEAEAAGKQVSCVKSLEELNAFQLKT